MDFPDILTQAADFIPMFSGTAQAFPGCTVEEAGPFKLAVAAIPIPLFNAAIMARPTEEDELLAGITRFQEVLAASGMPGLVFAPKEWLAGHDRLQKVNELVWMGRALTDEDLTEPESCLVQERPDAVTVAEINAVANGMPAEFGELAYAEGLWEGGRVARLIREGEADVSGGAVFIEGDLAYVGWMATCPEHQRRGFGTALMRDLLAEGRRAGAKRVSLHATEAGRGLYERFGLVEGETFNVFFCAPSS